MSSNWAEIKEHTFTWKIEDLCLCNRKKGEYFESPVFRAKSLCDTSWCIKLYPRGMKYSDEGYMACYLNRSKIDNGDYEYECEYEISVLSSGGKILATKKTVQIFPKNKDWGWSNYWKKSLQPNDISDFLVVHCNIKLNALKSPLRSETTGETSFDSDKCSFKWIVKSLNSNCAEVIKLPYAGTPKVEICIKAPEDDIEIKIHRVEKITAQMSMMCQITLLDVKGKKHDSRHKLHLFETEDPPVDDECWEFPTFLKKSKLNSAKDKYLKDDSFTLEFKIAISDGSKTDSVEEEECNPSATVDDDTSYTDTDTTTVLEDFKKLCRDKIHADVKLLVEGEMIPAHKSILSIRSPVFLAMFDTNMAENETGTVNIPDFETETVNSLLEYMYTGTLEKLDYEAATKLIVAADKYQVSPLIEKCAHFLTSILSYANVCELLVIADMIQHETLKLSTVTYIKDNSEDIFLSEEWSSIAKKDLKLATSTFIHVSKLMAVESKNLEKK